MIVTAPEAATYQEFLAKCRELGPVEVFKNEPQRRYAGEALAKIWVHLKFQPLPLFKLNFLMANSKTMDRDHRLGVTVYGR